MKDEIVKEMLKNPKILKAMEGLVAPLEQEGDSLTIKTQEKEDELK